MKNFSIFLLGFLGAVSTTTAGVRVENHFPTVYGVVGEELRKSNGDHYFDVDWMDFDTAPDQSAGEGELTGFSGGFPGLSESSYRSDLEETPTDSTTSWYNPNGNYSGPYHPWVATPTVAGEYDFTLNFKWDDDVEQSVTVHFVIKEHAEDADLSLFNYSDNGDGSMTIWAKDNTISGDVKLPSHINGKPVTSIKSSAFYGCAGLTSVVIPNSVTNIGNWAFQYCDGLTSISIPLGVTDIGTYAFAHSTGLTTVTMPESIVSIGNHMFDGCRGLVSVEIPNSVTNIGDYAFNDCIGMTSVAISNRVMSIGAYAFAGCIGLTSVTIQDGVTDIGSCAFFGCSALTSIAIPDSVLNIGYEAFSGCSGLISVAIPNGANSIESGVFYGCSALMSITIPDSVTSIGSCAFYGCSSLTSIIIPDGVSNIGNCAFWGCSGLTSMIIPDGLTRINVDTFRDCSKLTSVTMPNSVMSIGNYAFMNCKALATINVDLGDGDRIAEMLKGSGFDVSQLAFDGDMAMGVLNLNVSQHYPWDGKVDIVVEFIGESNDVAAAECIFVATNIVAQAELNVSTVVEAENISGSGTNWFRHFTWDAGSDLGEAVTNAFVITVNAKAGSRVEGIGGVQLWNNGPYWAECNIGAEKPEDYGYYFWWGDTVGYVYDGSQWNSADGSRTDYKFTSSYCSTRSLSVSSLQSHGYIDATTNLVAAYDAAREHLGSPWRMPTSSEIDDLLDNCDTIWTNHNGIVGRLVTGRGDYASKRIFIPAAGYGSSSSLSSVSSCGGFWSSTPYSGDEFNSLYLFVNSDYFNQYSEARYIGRNVRPVRGLGVSEFKSIGSATAELAIEKSIVELHVLKVEAYQRYPWNGKVDIAVTFVGMSNDVASAECCFVSTNLDAQTALKTVSIVDAENITGSGTNWIRHYVWDAGIDLGEVKIDYVALTVSVNVESGGDEIGGVQLWENGPYWAECNVGAEDPEDYGYYFWWGDTIGYKYNSGNGVWVSVKDGSSYESFGKNCPTYGMDNDSLQSDGYIDLSGNLDPAYDAATTHLGSPWRMPTDADMTALIGNCTTSWITLNGVCGWLVEGREKFASRSIFLPAAGYGSGSYHYNAGSAGGYWSSTPNSNNSDNAWGLNFGSALIYRYGNTNRFFGRSVRPVRDFIQSSESTAGGTTTEFSFDNSSNCRMVSYMESIRFSPFWNTSVDGAEVVVSANGFVLTNSTSVGVFEWMPITNGIYTLTHSVYVDGVQIGDSLSTVFNVIGIDPVGSPIIMPADGSVFYTDSCTVTITCATEGASIYYRTDGGTPRAKDQYLYKGPFEISETCEIVAFAVKDGFEDSVFIESTITKIVKEPLTLAEAIDAPSAKITTGGDADWTPEEDVDGAIGSNAARSGMIQLEQTTRMTMSVSGKGTLSFKWKGDCEKDPRNRYSYDCGSFDIDGTVESQIDGETEWLSVSFDVETAGTHTFTWTYSKDDYDEEDYDGGDCIWVDSVVWTPVDDADPIPPLSENPTTKDVHDALEGSTDAALQENITEPAVYDAYRIWAESVKDTSGAAVAGQQAVKDSPHAWLSFALGSESLIAEAPGDGDIKIDNFEPSETSGKYDFEVSIEDVTVGNGATEENIMKVFGIEGSTALGDGTKPFSAENVGITLATPKDGKIKFTAGPTDTTATSFFMKVKMK